jgi:membrane protein
MAKKDSRLHKLKQEALALWDERSHGEKEHSRLHRFLHFWVLVVKSFNRNRCPSRAAALSFTTLLALIPMLAVAISVTSSLLKKQGEEQIYHFVDRMVSAVIPPAAMTNAPAANATEPHESGTNGLASETNAIASGTTPSNGNGTNLISSSETNQPAVATAASSNDTPAPSGEGRMASAQREVAHEIHEFIHSTASGTLGVTGFIALVVVGIRMFGTVESTLNDIWGVTRGRNWLSRIQIYCTATVMGPFLLVGAAALTSGPHSQTTRRFITHIPFVGPAIFPTLTLIVLWLAFAMFYRLVPNTSVRFKAAMVGGIVGGTVWHLNNLFGFLYVSRVVTNGRIYGKLGLVPVFMAGVYLAWYILLFGAQVAYAFQNRALYLQERIAENVNQRGREFVALRLMTCIGLRFQHGLPPQSSQEMSEELCVPGRLVQQVLQTLVAAHLVIEVSGIETAYSPGRPLEQINAHHILQAMRARGQELMTREEPVREEVYGEYARIQEAERLAASSITMLSLVKRADARLELAPPLVNVKQIEVLLPQVSKEKDESEAVPQPTAVTLVEVQRAAEPMKEKPAPKSAVVEPIPDDEREFPL